MDAQRLVPSREVLEAGVDAPVAEGRRGGALVGLPEAVRRRACGRTRGSAPRCVPSRRRGCGPSPGARRPGRAGSPRTASRRRARRRGPARRSRSCCRPSSSPGRSGPSSRPAAARGPRRRGSVAPASRGRAALLGRRHQVLVVREAGRVGQQVADRDLLPVSRERREEVGERVLVSELAVADEQHGGHRRELLGHRGEAEARGRVDAAATKVAEPVPAREDRLPVLPHERGEAGLAITDPALQESRGARLSPVAGKRRRGEKRRDERETREPHFGALALRAIVDPLEEEARPKPPSIFTFTIRRLPSGSAPRSPARGPRACSSSRRRACPPSRRT